MSGRYHVSERLGFAGASDAETKNATETETETSTYSLHSEALRNSIVSGFQFATNAGPICDEPMRGLAFIVEPHLLSNNSDVAIPSDDNIFTGK